MLNLTVQFDSHQEQQNYFLKLNTFFSRKCRRTNYYNYKCTLAATYLIKVTLSLKYITFKF